MLATPIRDEIERSADPTAVTRALERVVRANPAAADRIDTDPRLRSSIIAVVAASPWLARLCATDAAAIDVLAGLDQPLDPGAGPAGLPGPAGPTGLPGPAGPTQSLGRPSVANDPRHLGTSLARAKRLGILRIAARDLLGLDGIEEVGSELSRLASGPTPAGLGLRRGQPHRLGRRRS